MEVKPGVQFDDTAVAFSYKSDKELKKAGLIFKVVNHPFVSNLSTRAVKLALWLRLPVKSLIRNTVFEHFCGGETIEQCERTIRKLAEFHVGTILDYSVEGAKTEEGFETTTLEILKTFDKAKENPSIPFCVFKITGMATVELLEKAGSPVALTPTEASAYDRVRARVDRICAKAHACGVPVLVDAEDSWIQSAIDQLAYDMMRRYNKEKAIVFNTFQMYRWDMLENLRTALDAATASPYYLGVKLVRGAYMEKERARSEKYGYRDPINPTKESTDELFNKGLAFCIEQIERVRLVCGSHNETSNQYLAGLLEEKRLARGDERVWFAQLLGMSDNISFNLSKQGYRVAKYVPYGPVEAVMPYLLRRAAENTSVAGQSSRELTLLNRERIRRKQARKGR